MKKIKDYKILKNIDESWLEVEILKHINEKGYELYGSPFYRYKIDDCNRTFHYVCQAIVKYEEEENNVI